MKKILLVCTVIAAVGACATASDYDFRGGERPTFDRTVSADALPSVADANVVLLDVRLPEDYAANPTLIPGALYRNPEQIQDWASSLPGDAQVIVYCVKGKWVSQKVAHYLDERGVDVYSLEGGIERWQDVVRVERGAKHKAE